MWREANGVSVGWRRLSPVAAFRTHPHRLPHNWVAALILALASSGWAASATSALQPIVHGNGPSGRYSLDGDWMFRLQGNLKPKAVKRLPRERSTRGWSQVSVPSTWNANEARDPKMKGEVAWYRKDFELPSADSRFSWAVRFQSVNNRVQAWLNGKPIGSHTGAYLPFELTLPAGLLNSHGVNRLVLRVDSTRLRTDLPGVNYWWNYGGILRPVELVRFQRVGFASVQVLPELSCPTCAASVLWRVTLRNYTPTPQRVRLAGSYGGFKVDLGTATIASESLRSFDASSTLPSPHVWRIGDPYLYYAQLRVSGTGAHGHGWAPLGAYSLYSGVRSIATAPDGTLLLNGEVLNMRGVGLIEDSPERGGCAGRSAGLDADRPDQGIGGDRDPLAVPAERTDRGTGGLRGAVDLV